MQMSKYQNITVGKVNVKSFSKKCLTILSYIPLRKLHITAKISCCYLQTKSVNLQTKLVKCSAIFRLEF